MESKHIVAYTKFRALCMLLKDWQTSDSFTKNCVPLPTRGVVLPEHSVTTLHHFFSPSEKIKAIRLKFFHIFSALEDPIITKERVMQERQ